MKHLIGLDAFQLVPRRLINLAIWITSLTVVLFKLYVAYNTPEYNGDILFYVASAKHFEGKQIEQIHQETYADFIASNPTEEQKEYFLNNQDQYLPVILKDPEALRQQIPFYTVKPIYPALVYAAAKLGMNPFNGANLVSFLLFVGFLVVVFLVLNTATTPQVAALGVAVMVSLPAVFRASQMATPDGLSGLFLFLSFYGLLKNRYALFVAMLILSQLARPDNAILCVLSFIGLAVFTTHKREALSGLAISLTLYFLLGSLSGNYGLITLLHHSLVGFMPYPADYAFTWDEYGENLLFHYKWSMFNSLAGTHVLFFLLLGGFASLLTGENSGSTGTAAYKTRCMLFIVSLSIVAHIILVPWELNRLLLMHYALVVAGTAILLPKLNKSTETAE